jgi:hypothetical protein
MPSEPFMRAIFAALSVAAILTGMMPARAEKQIFIIANNADGYGIDRCLAEGASCGTAAAGAYCRSHAFNQAVSFRKVDRDDMTGAIPATDGAGCRGAHCDAFVAIECNR